MAEGWLCPKCGRVWAPQIEACAPCNLTRPTPEKKTDDTLECLRKAIEQQRAEDARRSAPSPIWIYPYWQIPPV